MRTKCNRGLFLGLLLVGGILLVLGYQKSSPVPLDKTLSTRLYQDSKGSFDFRYPAEWRVDSQRPAGVPAVLNYVSVSSASRESLVEAGWSSVQIVYGPLIDANGKPLTENAFYRMFISERSDPSGVMAGESATVRKSHKLSSGSYTWYYVTEANSEFFVRSFFLVHGGRYYKFSDQFTFGQVVDGNALSISELEKQDAVLDGIVSSFKLRL